MTRPSPRQARAATAKFYENFKGRNIIEGNISVNTKESLAMICRPHAVVADGGDVCRCCCALYLCIALRNCVGERNYSLSLNFSTFCEVTLGLTRFFYLVLSNYDCQLIYETYLIVI